MIMRQLIACIIWVASMLLATQILPFFGSCVGLLLPLPFIYYLYKLTLGESLWFTAVVVGVLGLASVMAGYPGLLMICFEFGILGLCLSELFKKRLSIGYTMLFGCLIMLLVGFVLLIFSSFSENMGPLEMVRHYLKSNLEASLESYNTTSISQQEATEIQAFAKVFIDIVLRIYPALMVIGSGFVIWVNILFSRSVFKIKGVNYPEFYNLERWQAPEFLVWPLIASGFALFFPVAVIKSIAINSLLILMVVYLYQGISILVFFIKKFNVPGWLKGFIYFFIIVQQFFLALLALVGLFDQWFDFRKIHKLKRA